tara:strand:+ start:16593 stop:16997 length:405 start_codon:yes stop_codon:yes gene_type:complete
MSIANPLLTNLPSQNSGSQTWIQFYNDLNETLGEKRANRDWMVAWAKRGSSSANTSDLRNELKNHNLTIDTSAWDDVVDTAGGIGSFVGGIGSGIKTIGYVSFGIIAFSVIAIVIGVATNTAEITGSAASALKK